MRPNAHAFRRDSPTCGSAASSPTSIKSCIKHPCPRASKRTLRTDENGEQDQLLPQGVKFIKRIEVNEEDGFQVTQRPGAVFITQFDTTAIATTTVEV